MKTDIWYRARAPLRLSFGGGGTDLFPYVNEHGGVILNGTVDRYVYSSIKYLQNEVVFESIDQQEIERLPLQSSFPLEGSKLSLLRATYNRIVAEYNDGKPLPIHFCTQSSSPVGSGLGSSSTLAVAAVACFAEALKLPLDTYEIAGLAHRIERHDLQLLGGHQDHYAAAFGGFNFMEFHSDDRVVVNPLRLHKDIQGELEASLMLYFTGLSRESSRIIEQQSKAMQESTSVTEQMHQIKEMAYQMKEHLLAGNIRRLAEVLHESWLAKLKTADAIATPEIERTYQLARQAGVWGGKVSGAGGGGFMMLIGDPLRRHHILKALPAARNQNDSCHFTQRGVHAWRAKF